MRLGLDGLTAIVTGGSSGIGLACVETFLDEGAHVVTCGRDSARLDSALSPLSKRYPGALAWSSADVCDAEKMQNLIDLAVDRFDRVDILVNNAGRSLVSTFASTTDEQWREELELKFFGVINPTRAALSLLKASPAAAIVNINAVLARQPEPHLVATGAARAGLLNLSKSMATEFASEGVRVNSVSVGLIDTGQWRRKIDEDPDSPEYRAKLSQIAADRGVLLARAGTAAEVASAVVFLASPRCGYTTGTQLEVAGGVNRYV